MKKDLIQVQKTLAILNHNTSQSGDDVSKLTKLVSAKKEKNAVLIKSTQNLKREVKILERDCDDLKKCKESIESEMRVEQELIDQVQQMILNQKKLINDVRRDKEKIQIQVKNQYKVLDNLVQRKSILDEDSTKLYMDFKDAMQMDRLYE